MTATRMVWLIMSLWIISLTFSGAWDLPTTLPGRLTVGAATLWFLLNFYVWTAPQWRLRLVQSRGPLLGFGFAFAAALVSALVDGVSVGFGDAVLLFLWRLLVMIPPFVAPFFIRSSPYPHLLDGAVLAYALALPHIPGFQGVWLRTSASLPAAGFFEVADGSAQTFAALGPGTLIAPALLATYFYGIRPWSAAPLDWTVRPSDLRHAWRGCWYALAGAAVALGAAGVGRTLWRDGPGSPLTMTAQPLVELSGALFGDAPGQVTLGLLVLALGLAVALESLLFRALLQSGLPHWAPKSISERLPIPITFLALPAAAGAHAAVGVYGLHGMTALGFALGLALAHRGANRFLPTAIGQAAALLVLATAGAALAGLD